MERFITDCARRFRRLGVLLARASHYLLAIGQAPDRDNSGWAFHTSAPCYTAHSRAASDEPAIDLKAPLTRSWAGRQRVARHVQVQLELEPVMPQLKAPSSISANALDQDPASAVAHCGLAVCWVFSRRDHAGGGGASAGKSYQPRAAGDRARSAGSTRSLVARHAVSDACDFVERPLSP